MLRALQAAMPGHDYIYLGDTARLPYGTKSERTVQRYAVQATSVLAARGIDALVVACNTASAVAIDVLTETYAGMPVFGVVEPGATAACERTCSGRIAVIATESTVRGGAYQREILRRLPDARIIARPCPLLVTLAEEGWVSGAVPGTVISAYLGDWLGGAVRPDVLLLGCTHFPILTDALAAVTGAGVTLIDSAATTAAVVERSFGPGHGKGSFMLMATDDVDRFARVGGAFLGERIHSAHVELVDL